MGSDVFKGDAHARETGILSGEALADSVVLDQVTKIIFRRERPLYNNAAGDFFSSKPGSNNSFPSSHSMLAWTVAGVTAGEYPSKWVQLGAYSLATSVSLMRVLGQEHFPTDVLVGGAAGWLIGHYVFEKHSAHDTSTKTLAVKVNPPSRETRNQRLLNDRYRIGELQINQQGQTVVDLDELGRLLGADRLLELGIVLSSKLVS